MTNIHILASVQWDKVGIAVGVFALIAVVLTVCILLITKLCKTKSDKKAEEILNCLAGANCGGCGFSGCAAFAEKLSKGEAELTSCRVTNAEGKQKIARILGVPYSAAKEVISVCRCHGGLHAKDRFTYAGAIDCHEKNKLAGGGKVCEAGCLSLGNCVRTCPESAISLPDRCALVDPDRCTACGACLRACPKGLFALIPADAKVYIACSSHERGKAVLDACEFGCIACGKCAKTCPSGAIEMVENLPVIDYEKCIKCGKCAEACPRRTILVRY